MTPAVATIVDLVAWAYEMPTDQLLSRRRDAATVRARHVAIYLVREHLGLSTAAIGRQLGGRDHTTVLHACTRVEQMIEHGEVDLSVLELKLRRLLARRFRTTEGEDFRRQVRRLSRRYARRVEDALLADAGRFMTRLDAMLRELGC